MLFRLAAAAAALSLSAALLSGCGAPATDPAPAAPRANSDNAVTQVVAISIDGLNPAALRRLGRDGAPHLHAFRDAGASTLNARTEYEQTVTLPNHTGMVTGRRIDRTRGGHGVTWNDDRRRPATVQAAAGRGIQSVFTVIDEADGSAAVFASKTKFTLWKRSWRWDIDRMSINLDNAALVRTLQRDLGRGPRTFRFLHLSAPDNAGHDHGFMSRRYLRTVRNVDHLVGQVVRTITSDPELASSVAIVLTSDHGGRGEHHSDATSKHNYRVPFMVQGPGVEPGTDLYELNPDFRDPGRARAWYGGERQPVRNGMLANLSLDLLDLPPVPGSEHNLGQDLDLSTDY